MIVLLAICLCLIAFGWLLPLLIILLAIGAVLLVGGMMLGVGMHWVWRRLRAKA